MEIPPGPADWHSSRRGPHLPAVVRPGSDWRAAFPKCPVCGQPVDCFEPNFREVYHSICINPLEQMCSEIRNPRWPVRTHISDVERLLLATQNETVIALISEWVETRL
jgi:hypothetical protein